MKHLCSSSFLITKHVPRAKFPLDIQAQGGSDLILNNDEACGHAP